MDFGCQNGANLASKCDEKSMLTLKGDFSKNNVFPKEKQQKKTRFPFPYLDRFIKLVFSLQKSVRFLDGFLDGFCLHFAFRFCSKIHQKSIKKSIAFLMPLGIDV